ncbi:beta-1,6-N-acetylglucosaminyltransferase [Turicibacter bilis]|uniref:beta-1,6-N-acetylglucosaminyltransferase n=1 Tax=Turicibacter bilis TaxID=2735723 RepID=UPI0031BA8468
MKQAFLIVAHKNFEQTKQLIEFIADDDHHVYIHIDQKNDGLFNQLKQYFQSFNTVFFLEQRMSINWGGLSQVLVTIQLLKQASNRSYDFYHLISGQDLFIKTKKEVSSFLKKNKGRQFLETLDIEENLWRIKGYYLFSDSKYNRTRPVYIINNFLSKFYRKYPLRPNFKGYKLYKGANWFTLSGDCVEYILNYLKEHPEYIRDYKYTICADEHFFQTLILNSPFKNTVVHNTLREIQWNGGPNPKTYTLEDYQLICESEALFARKFDSEVDNEIIKKVYQYIKE